MLKVVDVLKINVYIQWSSWWWESMKDGHVHSFQKKGPHEIFFPPQTCDKKEETNIKRWGLQVQKVGHGGENYGDVACMNLRW